MTLRAYLATRIASTFFMIFVLITIVFFLLHILPGDPVSAMLPEETPREVVEKFRHEIGLDKPMYLQYLDYLAGIATGNLGNQWYSGRPVLEDVLTALPATVELAIVSLTVGIPLALVFSIISAMNVGKSSDFLIRAITMVYYAVPVFWAGPVFQSVFSVQMGILPATGRIGLSVAPPRITGFMTLDSLLASDVVALGSALWHLILPACTVGFSSACVITRVARAEILNVLGQDYIVTAKAKGLSESAVVLRHAVKNALLPIMTVVGLQFAALLAGLVITESVYNLPGIGRLLISALSGRDFPLLRGVLVFCAIWVSVVTLAMDLAYAAIDPRIRH